MAKNYKWRGPHPLSDPTYHWFQVWTTEFAPGKWLWQLRMGDEVLLESYGEAEYVSSEQGAIEEAEETGALDDDLRELQRGITPWRAPDYTHPRADPRIARNVWHGFYPATKDFAPTEWFVEVDGDTVRQYVFVGDHPDYDRDWRVETVILDQVDMPLSRRLRAALGVAQLDNDDRDEEELLDDADVRAQFAEISTSAPGSADVSADLAEINAHRRAVGMRPLDPAAAGWSEEDVRIEAARIRRNPATIRPVLLSW